jgi:hypothetical protein
MSEEHPDVHESEWRWLDYDAEFDTSDYQRR